MSRSSSFAIIAILALIAIQSTMSEGIPSVTTFWPEVKENLTLVTWKHAVNSKLLLNDTLKSTAHMLEADVSLDAGSIPIMAHPPNTTSDLTLEEFLNTIISNTDIKKGIKLDFKTTEAFNNSIPILESVSSKINFPVWLNADILKGPDSAETPVNDTEFLTNANKILPGSTLSLGWTTKAGALNQNDTVSYKKQNIKEMLELVNTKMNKTQSITYAMRAGLLVHTEIDVIQMLLKNEVNSTSTLTIWSTMNDTVDAEKLSKLIKDIGQNKIFIDVPADLESKLHLNNSGTKMTDSLGLISSIVFGVLFSRILSK